MIKLEIGDALNIMPSVSDNTYDVILTDPPYNIGLDYGILTDDNKSDYKTWCEAWFKEARRISKAVIFTPGCVNLEMWLTKIEYPKGIAILYASNQCSGSSLGGFNHYEPILVYGNINLKYNVFKTVIKQQTNVGEHPCPKQLDIFKAILAACHPKPLKVLDIFAGSGTTLRACRELDIDCDGIEINPIYEGIIKTRSLINTPRLDAWTV